MTVFRDGTVPLAIMIYIDGSLVKHSIPVKPIYITPRNLDSVVSGKAMAWKVLADSSECCPASRKVQRLTRQTSGAGSVVWACTMHASSMSWILSITFVQRMCMCNVQMVR